MRLSPHPIFLTILLTSVFGAGIVDVLFTDVVPLRPYDGVIRAIPAFTQPLSRPFTISPVFLLFTVAVLILIASLALHFNPTLVVLTGRARIHSSHPHTAGRHKDYAPLRNRTLASQINIPVEQYVKEKREAFEKQHPKKQEILTEEMLWQD